MRSWAPRDERVDDGAEILPQLFSFVARLLLLELERQDDNVFAWAKRHVTFLALEEAIQTSATEILARFRQLVNMRRSRSVADRFVIALARVRGLTVDTAERASDSLQSPGSLMCAPALG